MTEIGLIHVWEGKHSRRHVIVIGHMRHCATELLRLIRNTKGAARDGVAMVIAESSQRFVSRCDEWGDAENSRTSADRLCLLENSILCLQPSHIHPFPGEQTLPF